MAINPEERRFSGIGSPDKDAQATEKAETDRLDRLVDKFYDELNFPIPAADKETAAADWQAYIRISANNLADLLEQHFPDKEDWAIEKLKAHVVFKEDERRELFDKAVEVMQDSQQRRRLQRAA